MKSLRILPMVVFACLSAVVWSGFAVYAQGHGFAEDPGQLGHYAVGHTSYMLTDASRNNRPVYLSVWYPVDPWAVTHSAPPALYPMDAYTTNLPVAKSTDWETLGYDPAFERLKPSDDRAFPLVMVSPSWGGSSWFYIYAGTRLASHGYVVGVFEHWGDGVWPWEPSDDVWTAMVNRSRDVSFGITELLRMNQSHGELLHHAIDAERIAMSGHSLGGYAAFALTGGDEEVCDAQVLVLYGGASLPYPPNTCVPTLPDPRIKAIVSIDGSGILERYRELRRITVPSLIMGEPGPTYRAFYPDGAFDDWLARPHAAINRSDSFRVDVIGTNHYSFTALCDGGYVLFNLGALSSSDLAGWEGSWPCLSTGPAPATLPAAEAHLAVTKYMIAFLDAYLHGPDRDPDIDNWVLTEKYALTHTPAVQFFENERCKADLPDHTYFSYRPYQTSSECDVAQKDPTGWFLSQ